MNKIFICITIIISIPAIWALIKSFKLIFMEDLKEALRKSDGKKVQVYQHKERGTWIDFSDCRTEYQEHELNFY